jgi:lipid A ethanolaminephosphotransferase
MVSPGGGAGIPPVNAPATAAQAVSPADPKGQAGSPAESVSLLARQLRRRPVVASEALLFAVSAWFIAACNGPFWHALLAGRPASLGTLWFAFAVGVACAALSFILIAAFTPRPLLKPLLVLLCVTTAVAVHYVSAYGVILDPTMIRNVLRTDYREAREFVSTGLVLALLRYAALPVAVVCWVRIKRRPLKRAALQRLLWICAAWLVAVVALLSVYRDFVSAMRNQRDVRYLMAPSNYVISLARALGQDARSAAQPRIRIGEDARLGAWWATRPRPLLFVMIVGETVRADHLSLNGYPRETTPELERQGVVNFPDVTSCGTATEASLPCMFSRIGRSDYDKTRIDREQGLLDVLATAGLPVLWRDNQSGCKGVCTGTGIVVQDVQHPPVPGLCNAEGCHDEILLRDLGAQLPTDGRSQVVVMHQLGNHGPAYFARYPDAFRRFTPTCDTAELRRCTREQVVNSYDNAIAYTDHVVAQVIDFLRSQEGRFDTALLYVSDHGESLGEHGLYLHGMPYLIAPREQTHVPLLLWMSQEFATDRGVDEACLRAVARQPASHDNLFHSVLGLLDVDTSVYRADLDLTATCRAGTSPAAQG